MPIFEFVSLLALMAVAWLWFDSVKVRDIALHEAALACSAENLQFLDETVAIRSLKPVRDDDGRLALRRIYSFEYSETGNNRRPGGIALLGHKVIFVNVGLRLTSQMPVIH